METQQRCNWVNPQNELYCRYHDEEWGTPIRDDQAMYELFLLETFQAGLSWITILKKREAFRAAFDGFNVVKVAAYSEGKIGLLLQDAAIIRSRGKIAGAIQNAKIVLELQKEFGSFCDYLWSFSGGKVVYQKSGGFRTTSPISDAMSADMKKRGMRYVGSVTIYSFLQAAGLVNDHEKGCYRYGELRRLVGEDGLMEE
ncbi:MAG TPA: DNA-3-methyladenine glycosylase I [Feifaniaceae bacterium]|nr:DNA-3-methyladenine glycosylase I [Feifaniaceae bacterium]